MYSESNLAGEWGAGSSRLGINVPYRLNDFKCYILYFNIILFCNIGDDSQSTATSAIANAHFYQCYFKVDSPKPAKLRRKM